MIVKVKWKSKIKWQSRKVNAGTLVKWKEIYKCDKCGKRSESHAIYSPISTVRYLVLTHECSLHRAGSTIRQRSFGDLLSLWKQLGMKAPSAPWRKEAGFSTHHVVSSPGRGGAGPSTPKAGQGSGVGTRGAQEMCAALEGVTPSVCSRHLVEEGRHGPGGLQWWTKEGGGAVAPSPGQQPCGGAQHCGET